MRLHPCRHCNDFLVLRIETKEKISAFALSVRHAMAACVVFECRVNEFTLIVWNNLPATVYASRLESFEVQINNLVVGPDWLRWKRNWKLIVLAIHQCLFLKLKVFKCDFFPLFHYAGRLNKTMYVSQFGYFPIFSLWS